MKQLTSYNRVAGYLNKVFDLLNEEFFESELSRPTITIQSTPKAYGHFSLREDTWVSKIGGTHEINIGAGTLSRPIEEVVATLLHEMVHYYNYVKGVQDCSRGNTYHNRKFRDAAFTHGLIVDHHDKYGWTITSPSDELLEFILKNDLTDILINRNEFSGFQITGTGTHNGVPAFGGVAPRKSSSRKYACPCCGILRLDCSWSVASWCCTPFLFDRWERTLYNVGVHSLGGCGQALCVSTLVGRHARGFFYAMEKRRLAICLVKSL